LAWFTFTDAEAEAGNPTFSSLGFVSQTIMDAYLTNTIIPAVEDLVNSHLRQDYTDVTVPAAVKHGAIRIAANALMLIAANKMGSLVRVGDWRVQLAKRDIFTPEIRVELEPYRSFETRTPTVKATPFKTDDIKERWDED
jgi:hypothetical protein